MGKGAAPGARLLAPQRRPSSSKLAAAHVVAGAALLAGTLLPASSPADAASQPVPVRHVVEILLENHTFDNLFGHLAGAEGIPAHTFLPNPHEAFDSAPPVAPSEAGPNQGSVGPALDNGRRAELMAMDRQADGKFAMDDYTQLPYDGLAAITLFPPSADPDLQFLATHYALAERNFQPEVGPTQPNVTASVNGSSEGWYFNNGPPASEKFHTIFDELQAAGRSWKIYYGVPPGLLAGSVWDRYMPEGATDALVGTSQFIAAARAGQLPAFSFVRPGFGYSEEPPEDLSLGDAWLGQLVKAVMTGPDWASTAIFIGYDEGGGFWDHVSPPQPTAAGYGTRTPLVVVSPYTRRGLIAETTTNLSVLSFVQRLWRLPPLDRANAIAPDLFNWFDFHRSPRPPQIPPVAPPETLRIAEGSGYSLSYAAVPHVPVTVDLVAEDAGLDQDPGLSGTVRLRAIGPPGAPAATLPGRARLAGGEASFRATFPATGYWRLVATGPDGSRGWATMDVGTGPDTPAVRA
ncbi:MAG: alkaline phosphatase family protein [Acidimicrobiales bacterium]